jgi:hypothetical protein
MGVVAWRIETNSLRRLAAVNSGSLAKQLAFRLRHDVAAVAFGMVSLGVAAAAYRKTGGCKSVVIATRLAASARLYIWLAWRFSAACGSYCATRWHLQ